MEDPKIRKEVLYSLCIISSLYILSAFVDHLLCARLWYPGDWGERSHRNKPLPSRISRTSRESGCGYKWWNGGLTRAGECEHDQGVTVCGPWNALLKDE